MGTSKVVTLLGVYLIVTIYTLSFYVTDERNSTSVEAFASTIQAEQIARAGLALAMTTMGSNSAISSYAPQSSSILSGSVVHSASLTGLPGLQSQITSTGTFNGKIITVTALFKYDLGHWRVVNTYIPPT